nr:unnamed protein product [Digitaria exilis]
MAARPVCSYSLRLATRAPRSLSSSSSTEHVGSPAIPGADHHTASFPLSSMRAASACSPRSAAARAAAMSSVAVTRTRSRSTSMDTWASSPSATSHGLSTTASSPATASEHPVTTSSYKHHTFISREAPLLVGVELADVHRGSSAVRFDADDAGHGVPGPAVVEHPGGHAEALADVGAAARGEASTARLAEACPSGVMRASRTTRLASLEKATRLRRSVGPRLSMTKHTACFTRRSLLPRMLALRSIAVTRSSGARCVPATTPGATACTSTAKLPMDASLATAGRSQCVLRATTGWSGAST